MILIVPDTNMGVIGDFAPAVTDAPRGYYIRYIINRANQIQPSNNYLTYFRYINY